MTRNAFRQVRQNARSLGRDLRDTFRTAGQDAARSFGQMLNGNFGAAMQGILKNPIVATVAIGIVALMGGIIGAGLAGAIILALGGAIAGLGIFLAANSGRVRAQWEDTLNALKPKFEEAAKPMLPVIESARLALVRMANDFLPFFERSLQSMQGPLQGFIGSLESGFKMLGQRAGNDIVEGFNTFLMAFGPEFESFMRGLGDSFGALGRTVRDHSSEIAIALRMILGLITTIIDIVNFLANVWVVMLSEGAKVAEFLIRGFQAAADGILGAIEMIMGGIVRFAEMLGLPSAKLRDQKRDFENWRNGVVADIEGAANKVRGFTETIAQQNARNKMTADISMLEAKVRQAKQRLQETNDKKVKSKIRADISNLTAELNRARAKLAAFDGTTATARIITIQQTISKHDPSGGRPFFSKGGITGAATGGVRNNMTWVGERGPELLNLPPGTQVSSNPDSMRKARQAGGGGGGMMLIQLKIGDRDLGEILVDPMRKAVAARGGNVQATLGKG